MTRKMKTVNSTVSDTEWAVNTAKFLSLLPYLVLLLSPLLASLHDPDEKLP